MKKLIFLVVILAIFEVSSGFPRTVPKYEERAPQYLRNIDKGPKIVGGRPADIADFPHMLFLINLVTPSICGASVIHEHWALTAAHCLNFGQAPHLYNLRGGSTNRLSGGFIFQVDFFTWHPNFNPPPLLFDIALMRTPASSPMRGLHVMPIALSPSCVFPCCQTCSPEMTTITGWGLNEHGHFPTMLNQITLPIYNHAECRRRMPHVDDYIVCVWSGNGQDSCGGDSGGPLIRIIGGQRVQIAAVTAGSVNCGDGSIPSTNVRIEHPGVRHWITNISGV